MIRKSLMFSLVLVAVAATAINWASYATAAEEDKVLAKVGNETVKESDLSLLAAIQSGMSGPAQMTPDQRKKAVQYLVNMFVLAAQAEKDGLDKAPEVARPILLYKNDLLARMYLSKKAKDTPEPAEKDAKEYYDKNPAQFTVPESLHLHVIQTETEKDAKDALQRVKKGEKFGDVANQVSKHSSKVRGGDQGWIFKGALAQLDLPELDAAAFKLKKGQVSEPVKTKSGYYLVMVEESKAADKRPFEEVKDSALAYLKAMQMQNSFEKLAESVKKTIKVEIDEKAVQGEVVPAGAPTTK
ncbi:MAG: peptidyl-prolyl cis-trans isomerase [Thermodesulfobacteriota bacterium]